MGQEEREAWHVLQRKGRHNLLTLFIAAILMAFCLHLLFCHTSSTYAVVSEAPITVHHVETSIDVIASSKPTACLPASAAAAQEENKKDEPRLVILMDGKRSLTFLPVSGDALPAHSTAAGSTQLVLIEGNHSIAFLPVGARSAAAREQSVIRTEAEATKAEVSDGSRTVDSAQAVGQPKADVSDSSRTVDSVPAAVASLKIEPQASAVDEKQEREDAERRSRNNIIRRWRVIRKRCNMYKGQWVYDNTYPLYNVSGCPFNRREFDCLKYGRPDTSYLKFRWQPEGCDLPRFNGLDFLWRWRGKKIMFVGDSLSVNNWVSLVCMLHAAVPPGTTSGRRKGQLSIARFEEYDVEIMNQWQPYLVDIVEEDVGRVLRLNSLHNNGTDWNGADLLIFNSWYWWWRRGAARPFDYFHDGEKLLKEMNRMTAFTQAVNTWAKWADISPSKTTIVYQGVTPSHLSGRDWGQPKRPNCHGQKHPVKGSTYPIGLLPPQPIVEKALGSISKPVHLLNITLLSQLRKDAHPGNYNGLNHLDCGHWCVGGLPDTWNQLLYAALV